MDLGFKVEPEMAEKPYDQFNKGKTKDTGVQGMAHNGVILDADVRKRLQLLARQRYAAGLHPTMANALTCAYTAFWKQWKRAAGHFQAEA